MASKSKSGGFGSMGFGHNVIKGVIRKGYNQPTPIQRKAIPIVTSGRDLVAMARTGSGKTAAFVLPMLERLKTRSVKAGARALILAPTRELAVQTHRFTLELGKFTDLRTALIVGGDRMDDQFQAFHESPDIIVATPGRLLHVVVEMELKLGSIEYLVLDEADRLFEMGLADQIGEILERLPATRQTLLFSATLPQQLVDFAKAGLTDPELVRLDVESKLSENLRTVYISCRHQDKTAVLLHLLKWVIDPEEMTVIFAATRHHVDYLRELLERVDIQTAHVYSSLDQEARKINVAKFRARKVKVLVVTDVAARGIDIPMLDNAINYNFPSKAKLFVHRVGRVARAGRTGTAYSLVATDEAAYVQELHLFLGRPLAIASTDSTATDDGVFGCASQSAVDAENDVIAQWHEGSVDLQGMERVCENAMKQYIKSRVPPSGESVKRMKKLMAGQTVAIHPLFKSTADIRVNDSEAKLNLLESIKSYRPRATIFEIGNTSKNEASGVMRGVRKKHGHIVKRVRSTANEVNDVYGDASVSKSKDTEFYVDYLSASHHSEKGLGVEKSFGDQMNNATFDMIGDEADSSRKQHNAMKWDRKKKRYVREGDADPKRKKKKIKTESGTWIDASYKSDLYKRWKEKTKLKNQMEANEGMDDDVRVEKRERDKQLANRPKVKGSKRGPRRELKSKDEILKERKIVERKRSYQKWKQNQRKGQKSNRSSKR